MKKLSDEIVRFFQKQPFVYVSTVGRKGCPHNSCKGIVKIAKRGKIYLMDLYKQKTFANLKHNPHISITAADEHKFKGWCLKGKAESISKERLTPGLKKAWQERVNTRIANRLLKNMREEKGHSRHPESQFPMPEYMIIMEVEEIVDLKPHHVK